MIRTLARPSGGPGPTQSAGAYLVLEANFLSKFLLPQEAAELRRPRKGPKRLAPSPFPHSTRGPAPEAHSPLAAAHMEQRPQEHRPPRGTTGCVGGANMACGRSMMTCGLGGWGGAETLMGPSLAWGAGVGGARAVPSGS